MMSQPVPYLPKARNNVYKKKIYLLPQRHHLPQGIHIHPEITLMILLYFLCIVVVIAFFLNNIPYKLYHSPHNNFWIVVGWLAFWGNLLYFMYWADGNLVADAIVFCDIMYVLYRTPKFWKSKFYIILHLYCHRVRYWSLSDDEPASTLPSKGSKQCI